MTDLRGKTVLADAFHAPVRGETEALAGALIAIGPDGTIGAVTGARDPNSRSAAAPHSRPERSSPGRPAPTCCPALSTSISTRRNGRKWARRCTGRSTSGFSRTPFRWRRAMRTRPSRAASIARWSTRCSPTEPRRRSISPPSTRRRPGSSRICLERGQRALIGKVAMDDPDQCPDYYRDASAEAALAGTRAFVEAVRAPPGNGAALVRPAVTPRFIPSCTDRCSKGSAVWPSSAAATFRPTAPRATGKSTSCSGASARATPRRSRLRAGRPRDVLAHANFVSGRDLDLIAAAGPESRIARCRTSTSRQRVSAEGRARPRRPCRARHRHFGRPERIDVRGGPHGGARLPAA